MPAPQVARASCPEPRLKPPRVPSKPYWAPRPTPPRPMRFSYSVSTRSFDTWVGKRMIPFIQITPRFSLYDFEAVLAAGRNH